MRPGILGAMRGADGEVPRGFGRYWTAHTLSAFGTSATAVALPVLVVTGLDADPYQVGLVNAAQRQPEARARSSWRPPPLAGASENCRAGAGS
jgi:hypothetical protein